MLHYCNWVLKTVIDNTMWMAITTEYIARLNMEHCIWHFCCTNLLIKSMISEYNFAVEDKKTTFKTNCTKPECGSRNTRILDNVTYPFNNNCKILDGFIIHYRQRSRSFSSLEGFPWRHLQWQHPQNAPRACCKAAPSRAWTLGWVKCFCGTLRG